MQTKKQLGKSIRMDFPFYQKNSSTAFLDSAASSLTPKTVIDAIDNYYNNYSVNIHRGMYRASLEASEIYEQARKDVLRFIGGEHGEAVFTRNTTEGFNLLSYALERVSFIEEGYEAWKNPIDKNDVILLSESEHHANIVPWHLLRERTGVQIEYVPIDTKNATLNAAAFEEMKNRLQNKNVKIVSLSAVSNVSGVIHDLTPFKNYAREKGAIFIVDGAQSICHIPTDVKQLDADFFLFSAHKMLAATGTGVLWGKQELLQKLPPFNGGGSMINLVKKEGTTYDEIPSRFEAGTPHIAGAFSLSAAIHYLEEVGLKNIQEHEERLFLQMLKRANNMGLRHFGPSIEEIESKLVSKVGVFSFAMNGVHHHDIATLLDEQNVAIRVGHHCCQLFMQAYEVSGTARASLYLYNDEGDLDKFFNALQDIKDIFSV